MNISEILKRVDHTLLSQTATFDQIQNLCDDAMKYGTASVCIPASFVKRAKKYTNGNVPICTVIGFPNGYSTTEAKVFEAKDAVEKGADEVDMVINIGQLKDGNDAYVTEEIRKIKEAVGDKVLKVIIETCLLTDEEKTRACEDIVKAGADFAKTSTGFSTAGATVADVKLMKSVVKDNAKVKAAGGVRSKNDMLEMIEAGADRIGTSRGVSLMEDK